MGDSDSAHKKLVDCVSRANPFSAVAVAPVSFFTQLSNRLLAGTVIDALVTLAEVPPGPGSVIGEETGRSRDIRPRYGEDVEHQGCGIGQLCGDRLGDAGSGAFT